MAALVQAAAAFGAGIATRQACAGALPACSRSLNEGGTSFKLSVQVHAASIPALGQPGVMSRPQPRVSVSLGGACKETEVADFVAPSRPHSSRREPAEDWGCGLAKARGRTADTRAAMFTVSDEVGTCKPLPATSPAEAPQLMPGSECGTPRAAQGGRAASSSTPALGVEGGEAGPWRFGDTLTFSARTGDLHRGGLRIRLSAASGVQLGPWQVDMPRPQELGEAVVDLQRTVLPACAPAAPAPQRSCPASPGSHQGDADAGAGWTIRIEGAKRGSGIAVGERLPWWETPVLVVPLTTLSESPHRGAELAVAGRVAVSFSVSVDPEALLQELDPGPRPLAETMERALERFTRWLDQPVHLQPFAACGGGGLDCAEVPNRLGSSSSSARGPGRPANVVRPGRGLAEESEAPAPVDWAYRL